VKSVAFGVTACASLAMTLVSCSSTTMVSHWADPAMAGQKLGKVLVIGVAKNDGLRRQFEDTMVASFKKNKVEAIPSYTVLPQAGDITEEAVADLAKERGITQVSVTRLIDKQKVQEYVPPSVSTTFAPAYPSYYYGGWYGYYSASYATVVTPGYTYETTYVSLETNVYDVGKNKLAWSGVTSTELGSTAASHISELVATLMAYMKQDKIL
jgi:hypothetical protein